VRPRDRRLFAGRPTAAASRRRACAELRSPRCSAGALAPAPTPIRITAVIAAARAPSPAAAAIRRRRSCRRRAARRFAPDRPRRPASET